MKIKNYIVSIFILSNINAYAECPDPTLVKLDSLSKLGTKCTFLKKLAADPKVEENHKRVLYKKLAKKLALQIKQTSEEISILSNFYSSHQREVGSRKSQVYSECSLEKFKKISECSNSKSAYYSDKINFLKGNFPSNKNTKFASDQSLYGVVAGKFYSDLGIDVVHNEKTCPLNAANLFSFDGQLDDKNANNIINTIDNEKVQDELNNKYVQLKIVKNSGDKDFINQFKQYLKRKDPKKNSNQYISNFFFEEKNQEVLAQALTKQCKTMNENLNTFLCSDLDHLGSFDKKASRELFDGLNPDQSLEEQTTVDLDEDGVLIAYGLQCVEENKLRPARNKDKPKEKEKSTDQWFADFTKETRLENDSSSYKTEKINLFCSLYDCKDEKIKNTNSCINGGPVTSADLIKALRCENQDVSSQCTEDILKSISLLKSLELTKKNIRGEQLSDSKNNSSGKTSMNGKLSAFAENFLGAEGTLIALGKEPTKELVANKKASIEERVNTITSGNLASAPVNQTTPGSTQTQKIVSASDAQTSDTNQPLDEIKPEIAQTPTSSQPAIASRFQSNSAKNEQKSYNIQGNLANSAESSNLRTKMEQMLSDLQKQSPAGSEESIASTQAIHKSDSNSDSSKTIVSSGKNISESRRLQNWADRLDEKERNLDDYARRLANREASSPSEEDRAFQPTPGRASGAAGVEIGRDTASGSSGSAGSTSSPALKLTSSGTGKEEQKTNTAAIIQSDKETSSISVDELTKLSQDSLKIFGIDATKPFTLRVNFKDKTYEVPVKSFVYNGSNVLGPVIDPKNKDLKEFLFKSPLFKSYLKYRMDRDSI